jgi:folate-binding protein YgfZ
MVVLSYLAVIRFSGADAGDFLHNQVSADILALANGESTFACYCEPKGRVLALMLVCMINDDYYVVLSDSLATAISNRLKMYVMRSKVTIEILPELTISGLKEGETPELATESILAIPLPGSSNWFALETRKTTPVMDTTSRNAWKVSELQRGLCWLSPETSGQFLPQWLGFDQLGAVNFRKGCYPGQEIVARMHYLGKVKRHPRILCTAATECPAPLDKIQIGSNGESFEAVVVDCECSEVHGACLFVVTRMDQDLAAEDISHQGQVSPLKPA